MKKLFRINVFALVLLIVLGVFLGCFAGVEAAVDYKLKKSLLLPVNASYRLTLQGADSRKVKWSTSDKKIASVSKKGVVKAKALGEAVVTAKYGKKQFKCKVTVKTLLYAHRGFSSEYPENTNVAFRKAYEKGFDGIECDVWETKSGDLLVCHDTTIYRTTGKNKYIWDITRKTRKSYPIYYRDKDGKKKKTYIPTLQEVAEIAFEYSGYINIHIKSRPDLGRYFSNRAVKKVKAILQENELISKAMIFTSGASKLYSFKNKGMKLGVNLPPETAGEYKRTIKWCKDNGVKSLIIASIKKITYCSLERAISYARENNVELAIYTVNKKKDFQTLCEKGAYFAMSDYYIR